MHLTYNGEDVVIRCRRGRFFRLFKKFCWLHKIAFESWDDGLEIEARGKLDKKIFQRKLRFAQTLFIL